MRSGRPKVPITLSKEEDEQLKSIANSRSLPHGLVSRARIVLMASEGTSNRTIAQKVDLSPQMVCKWRQRYVRQGLAGLHDELRPGRTKKLTTEPIKNALFALLHSPRLSTILAELPGDSLTFVSACSKKESPSRGLPLAGSSAPLATNGARPWKF